MFVTFYHPYLGVYSSVGHMFPIYLHVQVSARGQPEVRGRCDQVSQTGEGGAKILYNKG